MSLKCVDCGYLGDCKSFGKTFYKENKCKDTEVIKHYYCNCGDSKYYMQDVTSIEVTDCEEFEEI